jgi:regulator of sigma E protease
MTSLLAFLLVFTAVVLVHEAGHFLAARLFSVKVYEFSIGFPFSPRIALLFRHRRRSLRWVSAACFRASRRTAKKGLGYSPLEMEEADRRRPGLNIIFALCSSRRLRHGRGW